MIDRTFQEHALLLYGAAVRLSFESKRTENERSRTIYGYDRPPDTSFRYPLGSFIHAIKMHNVTVRRHKTQPFDFEPTRGTRIT